MTFGVLCQLPPVSNLYLCVPHEYMFEEPERTAAWEKHKLRLLSDDLMKAFLSLIKRLHAMKGGTKSRTLQESSCKGQKHGRIRLKRLKSETPQKLGPRFLFAAFCSCGKMRNTIKKCKKLFNQKKPYDLVHQYDHCPEYRQLLAGLPFLSTLLFKRHRLFVVPARKMLIRAPRPSVKWKLRISPLWWSLTARATICTRPPLSSIRRIDTYIVSFPHVIVVFSSFSRADFNAFGFYNAKIST